MTGTGTINDGGTAGTWHFEYSYSDFGRDFPLSTAPQQIGASPDDQPVSIDLPDIAAGETYTYRLVLELPTGTITGDPVSFTTPVVVKGPPPAPRTLFLSRRLHIGRDHRIPIRIGCKASWMASGPCVGSVQLFAGDTQTAPAITLPQGLTVPLGGDVISRLRLSKSGRRMLGRGGLTAHVVVRGFEGLDSLDGVSRPLSLR